VTREEDERPYDRLSPNASLDARESNRSVPELLVLAEGDVELEAETLDEVLVQVTVKDEVMDEANFRSSRSNAEEGEQRESR
jgi:hypothetical protein